MNKPIVPREIRRVYEGRIFSVQVETLTLPKGHVMKAEIIRHPGSVVIIPITDSGQIIEVVVFSKRAEAIEVVLGQGVHNVKCTLTPTRNGLAYAGKIMGREIVYERSRDQVQADIDRLNPNLRKSR